jgi:hypothetical protein
MQLFSYAPIRRYVFDQVQEALLNKIKNIKFTNCTTNVVSAVKFPSATFTSPLSN